MGQRIIQIISDNSLEKSIQESIKDHKILNQWKEKLDKARFSISLLVQTSQTQPILDSLQPFLNKHVKTQLMILPIEAALPNVKNSDSPLIENKITIAREEMYTDLYKNSSLTTDYLLLVFFSTIVAAVGLITSNIAVLVGAMVIAPFLGPNLALAFGVATGEIGLIKQAIITKLLGIVLVLTISVPIGFYYSSPLTSYELTSRTYIDFSTLILAFASGAAGVLSLTGGTSSVLVGVMVAVALLPPATTAGIMLGSQEWKLAFGALELLLANIVCLNLAAKLVFYFKGISARTWHRRKKASYAMQISLAIWIILLLVLILIIYTNTLG